MVNLSSTFLEIPVCKTPKKSALYLTPATLKALFT